MEEAALAVSAAAFIAALLSAIFAGQQARAARTQADAAKVQADAAKVQADAAKVQAEVASQALRQSAAWRAEDEERSAPRFVVKAIPFNAFRYIERDGERHLDGTYLSVVEVVVLNTSARGHTLNHVGIEDLSDGGTRGLANAEIGISFPCRLPSGHQVEFSLPGTLFDSYDVVPPDSRPADSAEFAVFVGTGHFFELSNEKRWSSDSFVVDARSCAVLDEEWDS